MKRNKDSSNSVEYTELDKLCQQDRLNMISEDLIKYRMSRRKVVSIYMNKWNISRSTANAMINEAIAFMASEGQQLERDSWRTLNSERLETMLAEDDLSANEKIKIIDLINKTNGVYEQNVNVSNKTDETFKFDIGV